MKNEFVDYNSALALKELGFNEPCLAQYKKYDVGDATLDIGFSKNEIIMQFHKLSKFCSAPLYQQAFKWFRENYDITYSIIWKMPTYGNGYKMEIQNGKEIFDIGLYSKYEEAELGCLIKLIEIVKENK